MKDKKDVKHLKTNNNFLKQIDSLNQSDSKEKDFILSTESNHLQITNEINSLSEESEIENNKFNYNHNFHYSQNENIFNIKEIIFDLLKNDKTFKIEQLNNFIINEQKQVNNEYTQSKKRNSQNKTYKLEKLESLIAKYCIIIYYYIQKNNLTKAKNLLLLMIQENIKHLNYHTFRLFKIYTKLLQKYEIISVYPKSTKELFKIYSILIKYCSLFNLTIYKNMFLVRYLSLHSLNFKIFKRKFEIRGFKVETRDELKYLFSLCLHYASFFSIKYLSPLKVPIKLCELILKVFRNLDDTISTKKEETLIINTLYNQSIFYYLNNQIDNALRNLRLAKQKIISYYNKERILNNVYNKFTRIKDNNKIKEENNTNNLDPKKISFLNNFLHEPYSREAIYNKRKKKSSLNSFYYLEKILLDDNGRKNNFKLEDLINIFDLNDNTNKIKKPLKKAISVSNDTNKIKKLVKLNPEFFQFPNYLKEPLLFEIEIFMAEIELDRRNYDMSYQHIKNSLILILFLKKFGDLNNDENQKRLNLISNFLEEIKKHNETKLSHVKSLENINVILNNEKIVKIKEINNREKGKTRNNDEIIINDEIEKLFIFLNSLSVYQIKLFNETQPNLGTRNEMPIFFSNQFKDSLSNNQRTSLDKLNIMSISRSSLLSNPNKSILPSNLKLKYPNDKIKNLAKNKKDKTVKLNFDGSLTINNLPCNNEEKKENFEINENKKLNELKMIFLAIENKNKLKSYLLDNIYFVYKILFNSNNKMIEEMIKYPEIIIETIKLYKQKFKYDESIENIQKEMITKLLENPQFNFLLKSETKLSGSINSLDNPLNEKDSNIGSSDSYNFTYSISLEKKLSENL